MIIHKRYINELQIITINVNIDFHANLNNKASMPQYLISTKMNKIFHLLNQAYSVPKVQARC